MTEEYILRTKTLVDRKERKCLFGNIFGACYIKGCQWYEGESLDKSGWDYYIKSSRELSITGLETLKEKKGLLVLTNEQAEKLESIFRLNRTGKGIMDYPIEIIDSIPHLQDTEIGEVFN